MTQTTIIEPTGRFAWSSLREVWRYRDTLHFLARRDVAVRYKQTAIGMVWVIVQPVAFALVYSAFLGLIGTVPSEGVPFGVFALTGMTLWLFFVSVLSRVSGSAVASASLISKIWFPRLIVPLAAAAPALVDLVASGLVLLVAMLVFGVIPEPKILLAPVATLLALLCALGAGVWFAAISVRYRDIQQLVPFLIQVLLFATPILYPSEVVPDSLQTLYAFNPFVGMVEFFRWTVLPEAPFTAGHLAITVAFVAIVLPSGFLYYERRQHLFADVI